VLHAQGVNLGREGERRGGKEEEERKRRGGREEEEERKRRGGRGEEEYLFKELLSLASCLLPSPVSPREGADALVDSIANSVLVGKDGERWRVMRVMSDE
jgi:hypothetical protein